MKVKIENVEADIELKTNANWVWSGDGVLKEKIEPGEYTTSIGEILILDVRSDLEFSFIGIDIKIKCPNAIECGYITKYLKTNRLSTTFIMDYCNKEKHINCKRYLYIKENEKKPSDDMTPEGKIIT